MAACRVCDNSIDPAYAGEAEIAISIDHPSEVVSELVGDYRPLCGPCVDALIDTLARFEDERVGRQIDRESPLWRGASFQEGSRRQAMRMLEREIDD